MASITTPASGRRPSPTRQARADALAAIVGRPGVELLFDRNEFEVLRSLGWTRKEVLRAFDDLVVAGRATITTEHGILIIELRSAEAVV